MSKIICYLENDVEAEVAVGEGLSKPEIKMQLKYILDPKISNFDFTVLQYGQRDANPRLIWNHVNSDVILMMISRWN